MLLWLLAAMPALATIETAPKKSSFSKAQRADIEIVIKEYLMKNHQAIPTPAQLAIKVRIRLPNLHTVAVRVTR